MASISSRWVAVTAWTSGRRYREALQPLAAAGRLTIEDQRVRLTRDGMLVANDIMQLFV